MSRDHDVPEEDFDPKVVAKQITALEHSLARIQRGGLNRRAVVALLHDHTKIGKRQIELVLDGLTELRDRYVHFPKPRARLQEQTK